MSDWSLTRDKLNWWNVGWRDGASRHRVYSHGDCSACLGNGRPDSSQIGPLSNAELVLGWRGIANADKYDGHASEMGEFMFVTE